MGSRAMASVILLHATAVAAGAIGPWIWLLLFADRFASGLTLSGLNPDGGGPGFLLLLTAGMASLLVRPGASRRAPIMLAVIESSLLAVAAGAGLWLLLELGAAPPGVPIEPVISGVIAAFLVPRVVESTLHAAWSEERRPTPAQSLRG